MTSFDSRPSRAFLLPLVLLVAAVAFRWAKLKGLVTVDALENFAPWMALAFTGTLVLSKRVHWMVIPLLLLVLNLVASGQEALTDLGIVSTYVCFALAAFVAGRMRGKSGLLGGLLGVVGCSVVFYLVTNTVSWLVIPDYAKNLSGWVQALTTGVPGYPATSWFLTSSLLSDLGFSVLLLAAYNGEAAFRHMQRIPLLRPVAA